MVLHGRRVARVGPLWGLPVCNARVATSQMSLGAMTSSGCAALVGSKQLIGPPRQNDLGSLSKPNAYGETSCRNATQPILAGLPC